MSLTKIADIIEPAVYMKYSKEYTPEEFTIIDSAAITSAPPEVAAQMGAGGTVIDMPFWQDTDRSEPDLQTDDDAVIATAKKITASKERARKLFLSKTWSQADLAGVFATGSPKDPLAQITDYIENYWRASFQTYCVKTLDGVLAKNVLTNASDMLYSVYSDITTPAAANKMSSAAITAARLTMGEMMNRMRTIIVHSKVYGDMLNAQAITFVQPKDLPFEVPMFAGMQVVMSDACTVVAGTNSPKYRSYLLGAGVIIKDTQMPDMAQEIYREPLKGNGGGVTSLITRRNAIFHPKGFQFTSGSVAGKSPTWAEISSSSNWARVKLRKNINIAYLETN
jgi:hypothetical protein